MNRKYLDRGTNSNLFQFARQNRKISTEAEEFLWKHVRGRKLRGFKFRRQQPMGNFILDFFCLEMNLAIEVDGGYHDEEKQKLYDEIRAEELAELHVTILRFTNDEVINNVDVVLQMIRRHLGPARGTSRRPHPRPFS
jgi:very-short-patch-repair endonuclease